MDKQDTIIKELLDAAYEGLNQLAIASSYVKAHGNTRTSGKGCTDWEANESGKDIIIQTIRKVEEAFPHLAA